jgi:hypothetical protein
MIHRGFWRYAPLAGCFAVGDKALKKRPKSKKLKNPLFRCAKNAKKRENSF